MGFYDSLDLEPDQRVLTEPGIEQTLGVVDFLAVISCQQSPAVVITDQCSVLVLGTDRDRAAADQEIIVDMSKTSLYFVEIEV